MRYVDYTTMSERSGGSHLISIQAFRYLLELHIIMTSEVRVVIYDITQNIVGTSVFYRGVVVELPLCIHLPSQSCSPFH